jgi:hypothetical protein
MSNYRWNDERRVFMQSQGFFVSRIIMSEDHKVVAVWYVFDPGREQRDKSDTR